MKSKIKKLLIVLAVLAILVGIGHIVINFLMDPDQHLATVAGVLKDATGLELKAESGARIWLLPTPAIAVSGVTLSGPAGTIAQVDGIHARMQLKPLFSKKILVSELELDRPSFTLVRDKKGNLNIAASGKPQPEKKTVSAGNTLPLSAVVIENIVIRKGHFAFRNEATDYVIEAENIAARAGPLVVVNNNRLILNSLNRWLRESPFSGNLNVGKTNIRKRYLEDITFSFTNDEGVFRTEDLTFHKAGAEGSAKAVWDTLAREPAIDVVSEIKDMDLASLSKNLYDGQELISGRASVSMDLRFQWRKGGDIRRGFSGHFIMVSDGMSLNNIDLEGILDTFEKTRVDLFEMGEYLVFGFFEPVITGSFTLAKGSSRRGQGQITRLHSHWKISQGIARTADVAFTTQKYRVAMQGQIDMVSREFKGFTIAVVDKNGCKRFGQTVNGPFEGSKRNVVTFAFDTVAHPIISLFKKGADLIFDCDVFYAGKVPHPNNQSPIGQKTNPAQ